MPRPAIRLLAPLFPWVLGVPGMLGVLSLPLAAQRLNDPATCPYCGNDPARMERGGVLSHGGFEFATSNTAEVDGLLATSDIRWIETKHFELGFALGSQKVKQSEKEKIRGELTKLQLVLPEVNPKEKVLDPWLRAHLYAQRLEEIWDRFLVLMQVEESDFPPQETIWNQQGKYMGNGPYVGQAGKYEVLLLPSEAASVLFLEKEFGLIIKLSQRWNIIDRDTLILVAHAGQGQLREDGAMHNHVAFNMAINLLDGFKHYSYDTPIWIREGLAHLMEREVSPEWNTFDSSEGAIAEMTRASNWEPEVKKLVAAGKQVRMAELIGLKDFAELTLAHHFTTWSMVDYLVRTNPAGFACLNDRLHGHTNAQGVPDGSNMPDRHRDAFKECVGVSYPEFDAAWAAWVQATYASK